MHFKTGESPLLPEFGVGQLYEYLYSINDKYTKEKFSKTLESILTTWEPRINIISLPVKTDENSITIIINYFIPLLNDNDSFVYTFEQ